MAAVAMVVPFVGCAAPAPVRTPEQAATSRMIARSATRNLRAMCKSKDPIACAVLGTRAVDMFGNDSQLGDREARQALETSCAANEVLGCYWLGRLLRDSDVVAEWARGDGLIRTACANGLEVCRSLPPSRHMGHRMGPASWQRELLAYLEAKCAAGAAAACLYEGRNLVGWEYSGGRHEGDDFERARDAFHRACQLGVSSACLYEGYVYEAGFVGAGGREAALTLYANACSMGDEIGCTLVRARGGTMPTAASSSPSVTAPPAGSTEVPTPVSPQLRAVSDSTGCGHGPTLLHP